MTPFARTALQLAAVAAGLALATQASAAAPQADRGKPIDLVLCLDVSNSMDGLIDSAKLKLWDVVNELAKVRPTPNLRVALYSYGHNSYPADNGWVRKDLDLTTDLDEVYAKLTALRTNGGTEYVARVTQAAVAEQRWADDPKALRVLFVCGNEPADQDRQVTLGEAAGLAKRHGVIVNTIYCGPATHPEAAGWREFATRCGGSYANIDQDRARRDLASAVKTPVDGKLLELSEQLNKTYVAYFDFVTFRGAGASNGL